MKIECMPRPQIQITFEYEELKELSASIERIVDDNKYMARPLPDSRLTTVQEFLKSINKVI